MKFWNGLKKSAMLIYSEAKYQASMARLKTEINRFEHEKQVKLEKLGKRIYEEYLKEPSEFNVMIQGYCADVKKVNDEISQKNIEFEVLRKEYQDMKSAGNVQNTQPVNESANKGEQK